MSIDEHGSNGSRAVPRPIDYTSVPIDASLNFRLIKVARTRSNSMLEVSLTGHVFDVDERPPYTAVSYTWGEDSIQEPAILNGRLITIGFNLHSFLDLHGVGYDYLWVDALSINQADAEEKSYQVEMMDLIYQQADTVVVWLGPGDEESDEAMQLLQAHFKAFECPGNYDLFDPMQSDDDEEPQSAILLPRKPPAAISLPTEPGQVHTETGSGLAKAMLLMSTMPYWHRMWIIQEVLLANNLELLWGDRIISWRDLDMLQESLRLSDALVTNETTQQLYTTHMARLIQQRRDYRSRAETYNLYDFLLAASDALCADVRDKIYALIGAHDFQPEAEPCRISPDYSRTPEELYTHLLTIKGLWGHYERGAGNRSLLANLLRRLLRLDWTENVELATAAFVDDPHFLSGINNNSLARFAVKEASSNDHSGAQRDQYFREDAT